MLAALPAVLTALAGWGFFLEPADREVASLRTRVERQGPLSARQALAARTQAERTGLEKAIAGKRAALAKEEAVFDRNRAMQRVSVLCLANNLSLNATTPDPAAKLPPALQEAVEATVHKNANGELPQVWRIELSGGYAGVLKLLDGLKHSQSLIVPLSVSMETGKNEQIPAKWVLTLWL